MKRSNTWSSLLGMLLVVGGCAAPTSSQDEVGSVAAAATEAKLLALGDSIAFGYDPAGDFTRAKNFVGYPEVLSSDYAVKNASCPGETSASLFSTTAPDNGCRSYRAAYPLHVSYGASPTQLEYALARLKSPDPGDVPTLITLNVSGNDFFLLQASCVDDPRGYNTCFGAGIPGLIRSVATNVGTIFSRIRGEGQYQGRLVYMNVYVLDYSDQQAVAIVGALNNAVAQVARAYGAQIADAFGAFGTAAGGGSACTAGLLLPGVSGPGCDVHPSTRGTQILASSVRSAN